MKSPLFSPYTLGQTELKHRVVMAPLTRNRAIDNIPNELMATYYGQRAGAGLIITEGTSPSPNGLGYPRIPGAFSPAQMEGWKQVTAAVHSRNGKIFLQIMHTGRATHPDNLPKGAKMLAPSAIGLKSTKIYVDGKGELPAPTPAAMSATELQAAIAEHVATAKFAIEAGFDGIELHAANGYLLEQFLHPGTNQRDDNYGGSTENRLRFLVEVATQAVAAVGGDKVGMRVSPYGDFNEMGAFDDLENTHVTLAKKMGEVGLTYMHIVDHEAMGTSPVPAAIKRKIQEAFGGTIILSGGYDLEKATADLEANKGNLVSFGRNYISNPDLVTRMQEGIALTPPNQETFYTPGPEGYTDYKKA